jgi:hypothetical protein
LATCRKEVVQWRWVGFGSSSEAAMIAMASAKEGSSKTGVWLIGISYLDAWDGWGWTQVYSMAFWEYVNVILTTSTYAYVPNLGTTSFLLMYSDV